MKFPRMFTTPLAGTVLVVVALSVLAMPLHRLTSSTASVSPQQATAQEHSGPSPAVLRLKLLDGARRIEIRTPGGEAVLDLKDPPAGESEHDVKLSLDHGVTELHVRAEFAGLSRETAVFVSVMPDGREDRTRFLTGNGDFEETLRFEWSHQDP